MIAKNIEILVTKVDKKRNSKTNLDYLSIGIVTLDDGSTFNVMERDEDKFGQYCPMCKYKADLVISSSQYGINISISNLSDPEGSIINN